MPDSLNCVIRTIMLLFTVSNKSESTSVYLPELKPWVVNRLGWSEKWKESGEYPAMHIDGLIFTVLSFNNGHAI